MVATGVWALSLGGSRGAVVLGAPLDLSFDVQPDPGTDIASACVTARIMAGETAIGDGRVRVTPLPDMRGRPPAVRVQAAIAVDEPVVTVTLSAGCTGKVTRTYTFLTELPNAAPRSGAPVDVSQLPAVEPSGVEPRREGQAPASARGAGAAAVSGAPSAPLAAAPSSPPHLHPHRWRPWHRHRPRRCLVHQVQRAPPSAAATHARRLQPAHPRRQKRRPRHLHRSTGRGSWSSRWTCGWTARWYCAVLPNCRAFHPISPRPSVRRLR